MDDYKAPMLTLSLKTRMSFGERNEVKLRFYAWYKLIYKFFLEEIGLSNWRSLGILARGH